jgi:hypothetical protein
LGGSEDAASQETYRYDLAELEKPASPHVQRFLVP